MESIKNFHAIYLLPRRRGEYGLQVKTGGLGRASVPKGWSESESGGGKCYV